MTHLKVDGEACAVSVSKPTPEGTTSRSQAMPPPLDVGAVQAARHAVTTNSVMVPMQYLADLLAAYDNLAARLAWMAAGGPDE